MVILNWCFRGLAQKSLVVSSVILQAFEFHRLNKISVSFRLFYKLCMDLRVDGDDVRFLTGTFVVQLQQVINNFDKIKEQCLRLSKIVAVLKKFGIADE